MDYYYKGHKIVKLGVFWQTQHGGTSCRACTRSGIESLIDKLTGCHDEKQNALYHLERAAQILERNLTDTSAIERENEILVSVIDEENELLVTVKRSIAKLIRLLSK